MLVVIFVLFLSPSVVHGWSFSFNLGEYIRSFFCRQELPGCKFSLNRDIPITPLILSTVDEPRILYPDYNNILELEHGVKFKLTCGNKFFNRTFDQIHRHDVIATCHRDNIVTVDDQQMPLSDLECQDFPDSIIRVNLQKTCYRNNTLIDIGYKSEKNFFKVLSVCFDKQTKDSIYSWYDVSMLHSGHQHPVPRPRFTDKVLYSFNVDAAYYYFNQKSWIRFLLGSFEWADQFIRNDRQHFLSRGHLTPKADFVYGFEQAATFHFINAAPQWQIFNAGNWVKLETAVRELIVDGSPNSYRVVTGTHGVATLPDVNNVEKELYLHVDENNNPALKVPKFYWKIVYDMNKKTGVTIIGVNNPFLKSVPSDYLICTDICDQITWLPRFSDDLSKGYIYCCRMNEFLNATGMDTAFIES